MTFRDPRLCRMLFLSTTLATLGACAQLDPMYKAGEWHPSGANETNLAAMVANPADLSRGVDTPPVDGLQAAAAVARLRLDKVKPLPDSGIAELRIQAGGNASSGETPGAGGS